MNTEKEIALIHEELQELNKKIDRIYHVLIGDDEMKIEGLVSKVQKHDKYIQNQRLQVARLGGIATAAGVVGGLIVQFILKCYNMEQVVKELIQYGALGVVCIGMGYMIFSYWKQDRAEKQRLIERLEKLNDELREKK